MGDARLNKRAVDNRVPGQGLEVVLTGPAWLLYDCTIALGIGTCCGAEDGGGGGQAVVAGR